MQLTRLELKDILALALFTVFCVFLSGTLWYSLWLRNTESTSSFIQGNIREVQELIVARMKLYEYGVRGVRGAVTTVGFDMFTRQDYLDYFAMRNIDSEFPGARGMGVIYRLSKSKVSDFEAAMSADYGEPKVIKSLGENEGEHYVIRFLEPYSRNVNAVGLDIASETNRRVAANFAMETGLATLTGPITVLQAIENKDSAFLLLLPIYAPAVPLETSQQRDEATLGWAYSVLVFNEIVKDVAFSANHLAVQLTDITNPANPEVFFNTPQWADTSNALGASAQFQVHGRTWRMDARALPSIDMVPKPYNLPWIGFLLALLSASLCIVAYLLLASKQRTVMQQRHQTALTGSIIEASSMGTLLVDTEGHIVRLNGKIKQLFGYAEQELLGKPVELLVPEQLRHKHVHNRQHYDGRYLEMAATRSVFGRRADGSSIPLEVTLNSIEVNGQRYVLAGVTDITERVRFLQRIQESEASWRGLANSLPQLVWTLNAQGKVDFLSEQWGLKIAPEDDVQARFFDCTHADDLDKLHGVIATAVASKQRIQIECRFKRPVDEQAQWYDLQLVPLHSPQGDVVKWIGSNTNIQFRKAAETEILALNARLETTVQERTAELQKARQNLNNILDAVPTMIGYWNRRLINEFANQSLYDFLHKARVLKTGPDHTSLFEQLFDVHSPHVQAALSGKTIRFEQQIWLTPDMVSYYDIYYIPHTNQDKVVGFYVLMQDISGVRKAQLEAELASRQKSSFLAVMSHEIRTPLNGILGFASLLAEKIEEEELRNDALLLKANTQILTVILNDILDISKVESGKMKLESIVFSLQEQLDSCCMLHQIALREKGIGFETRYEGFNNETRIVGDPTRVRQIIHNLLSNAVKFTSEGKVSLRVVFDPTQGELGNLHIEVTDTGVGIPIESQDGIFQAFYQGENSTFRKFGGTGLGLSVIKSIVTAMAGKVWFKSTPGLGTTFFVDIPVENAQTDLPGSALEKTVGKQLPKRILIVDDMPLNLKVLRKVLEHDQHVVLQAGDGQSAFDLCESQKYDLIFLDISMPGMDGYDTAKMIRNQSAMNKSTPIVALSGHAFDEDVQMALQCGMNAHLSKPIEVDKLRQRIAELTQ